MRVKHIQKSGSYGLAFSPRLVAAGRYMFELVRTTGNKHGQCQYKTFRLQPNQALLTEEKVRSMGYDTDRIVARYNRMRSGC
jgi:hypothetical protein